MITISNSILIQDLATIFQRIQKKNVTTLGISSCEYVTKMTTTTKNVFVLIQKLEQDTKIPEKLLMMTMK